MHQAVSIKLEVKDWHERLPSVLHLNDMANTSVFTNRNSNLNTHGIHNTTHTLKMSNVPNHYKSHIISLGVVMLNKHTNK